MIKAAEQVRDAGYQAGGTAMHPVSLSTAWTRRWAFKYTILPDPGVLRRGDTGTTPGVCGLQTFTNCDLELLYLGDGSG